MILIDNNTPVCFAGGKSAKLSIMNTDTEVNAALAASIFHYETHSVNRVKELIQENNIPVRY